MSNYRPPSVHSLLTAAYKGLPNADPKVPMTTVVRLIRRIIYDLERSGHPEHRLGLTEVEIAQALARKRKPVFMQADFQRAYDHLESLGQVSAVVTSRGTCYSLTANGEIEEEAARLPWWRKQIRAALNSAVVDLRGRVVAAVVAYIVGALTLGHYLPK